MSMATDDREAERRALLAAIDLINGGADALQTAATIDDADGALARTLLEIGRCAEAHFRAEVERVKAFRATTPTSRGRR